MRAHKGNLIDNLLSKEGEMWEVCFLLPFPAEKVGNSVLCKTRSHTIVVVNDG